MKDGGPAFPVRHDVPHPHGGTYRYDGPGMSLRDWFAGQVVSGLGNWTPSSPDLPAGMGYDHDLAAKAHDSFAYTTADAMLAER